MPRTLVSAEGEGTLRDGPAERVVTLDVVRGLAITGMVFLHNGAFHFAGLEDALESPPPWLVAFGFLLLWAGLFGVVSGAAHATTTLRRLERHRAAEGVAWRYPHSLLAGALRTFVVLFALHWLWTIGVGNSPVTEDPSDPALRVTLLPGWMYYGFLPRIHRESWVFASALWMIGANVLLVAGTLRWRYRRAPPRPGDGLPGNLLLLAALVLLATPLLRAWLFPPMTALVERGGVSILAAIPLALLVNDPNPVFPFFAYGLLGACAGASLALGEPRRLLTGRIGLFGLVLVMLGAAGLAGSGGVVLAGREEIWGQSPLYFSSLCYLLLGLFAWLLVGLLAAFDPPAESARGPWRPPWLRSVVRFGRLSLTVFLLEGLVAMALRIGLDALHPGWNATLGAVLAFALGNVVLWHGLLIAWERLGYRGSLEWWLARLPSPRDRARPGPRALAPRRAGVALRVERLLDAPLITPETDPSIGRNIQGPSLIRVPDWVPNPLGRYYLYFADHKGRHIRLAHADALRGPWTVYPPGALHLDDTPFPSVPPEVPPGAVQRIRDFLARSDPVASTLPRDLAHELTTPHIASPDVHVDDANRRIVMYYHGLEAFAHQVTRAAVSRNGLHFQARPEILGKTYLRAFRHAGVTYALAMPGQLYRSKDGLSAFEEGPRLFEENMRHAGLLKRDSTLYVFWTRVGDAPERILLSSIDLSPPWEAWTESEPVEVLRPERPWEGADAPLEPSVRGVAPGHVNQLRDPAVFEDDGRTFLLYAVAGESGLAIAEVHLAPAPAGDGGAVQTSGEVAPRRRARGS